MDYYIQQAEDFLTECDASIDIRLIRNAYAVTITTPRGHMSFTFWDSIANTMAKPTSYHILACMTKYDPGLFEEFCSEFGYDEDSKTADRVYMAVMREYKQLERIFTAKQMEKLRKIN